MVITRRKPGVLLKGPECAIKDRTDFSPRDVYGVVGDFVNELLSDARTRKVVVNPEKDSVTIVGGWDIETIVEKDKINSDPTCKRLGLAYHPNGQYPQ